MAVRIQSRQHEDEGVLIDRRRGTQRGGAERRPAVGQHVLHGRQRLVRPQRPECRDRLQAHVGIHVRRRQQRREWACGVGRANLRQRARRRDREHRAPLRRVQQRHQNRCSGRVLERAEPPDRERARVQSLSLCELFERMCSPRIADALQRVRDRPPGGDRVSASVEDGRRQRVPSLQAHEREQAEPHSRRVRRSRPRLIVRSDRGDRATFDVCGDHLSDGRRRRGIADQPERLGRAAAHERIRILQRRDEGRRGGAVAEQAEAERGHASHVRVRVRERRLEERHAVRESGASDRERGATADARRGIRQKVRQIGRRRRRRRGRGALALHGRRRGRRRRYDLEDALVLELKDPAHLLLIGHDRRGRDGRRARAPRCRDGDSQTDRNETLFHTARLNRHAPSQLRSRVAWVAAFTRSQTTSTPMPGPVGTAIVPSARTSIGGSIRSGA